MATKKTAARKPTGTRARPPRGAAHSTVSGPAREAPGAGTGAADALQRKMDMTGEVAAALPYNANKPLEYGEAAHLPEEGQHVDPAHPARRRQHADRDQRLRQGRQQAATGVSNATTAPLDRVRVDSRRAGADDQPGRAGRRQPELAEGRAARPDAARGLHPPREDHALRPRAHSRAHRACARLRRARLLRVLRAADASSPARRSSPRPASARRCSCASRPWPASAARPTRRATCAASR